MTGGSGALAYPRQSASRELWKCLKIDAAAECERSLETLRDSCASSPRDWELRLGLARALLGLGRAAEAVTPTEQALAIQPEVTDVMEVHRAVIEALQASDPDLVRLELACSLEPEDGARHLVLGETYVAIKRYRDAERHLQLALACGRWQEACADLGALYLSIGRLDLAEGYATAALKNDCSATTHANAQAMAHQTLAVVFSARGDQASSTNHLDAAYSERSFFHQPASNSAFTTLVLVTRSEGNVPYKSLLPPLGSSYVTWYMEHARPEDVFKLPPYHVVLNAIGDPDAAAASRAMVDHFISKCKWPILNRPGAVDRSRRDNSGRRWGV